MVLRRVLAGAAATAATTASLVILPAATAHADTGACGTYGTLNAYVWASNVRVHSGPHLSNTVIGECGPGSIHVYCQTQGDEVVYGSYQNSWWAYADVHLGNFYNGYLSDVFIQGGSNDLPIPGLPTCS